MRVFVLDRKHVIGCSDMNDSGPGGVFQAAAEERVQGILGQCYSVSMLLECEDIQVVRGGCG